MKIFASTIILFFSSVLIFSQNSDSTISVSAGKQYKAGWFYNVFFGKHWRDVWTTSVETKILNLNTFVNGLTPHKKGGGFQTKSLRFKGNDNQYWKFRSIEKDPSKTLPEDLRNTIANDILQDQISSANPYAAFVVAPILDSLKILQSKPYLYYLPDDPKLGDFRNDFGNMFGILEIHPKYDEEEDVEFDNADKVVGTLELFERLEKKKDEYVNSKEYLKARLADIIIGDWDRHADQWKWARYDLGKKKYWHPIPRDRDQAFSKFDGIFPSIAEYVIPQFNSFEKSFNHIEYVTWNGRFVDQHFLIQLTKAEWDSVTNFVINKLTNDLIKEAANKLPKEIYDLSAEEIIGKMKWRRNNLKILSNEYFNFVNTVVDIYGGNKKDIVEINRVNNSQTHLKFYKEVEDNNIKKQKPYFEKYFDNCITEEIRIYLNDGDDFVTLTGIVDDGILIRIIGEDGADTIIDSSSVNGYLFSILPISDAENKTKIYDDGKKTNIIYGSGTTWDKEKVEKPEPAEEKYRPSQRDRSGDTFFYPLLNFTSDDGFIVGLSSFITRFGFRDVPYKSKFSINAKYATYPSAGSLDFTWIYNSIFKNTQLRFNFDATQLQYTTYYGFGNSTTYDSELYDEDYYRLEQSYISLSSSLLYKITSKLNLEYGLSFQYSHNELENENLLDSFPDGNYGLGKFNSLNANMNFKFDSRDSESFTKKGVYLFGEVKYFPKIFDVEENFIKSKFDLRTYFTTSFLTETTLAIKFNGENIWNKFPFLSAAFLGGENNLLGFRRERFSGEASLYGISQLRMKLSKIKLIINGDFGIHGFADVGKVFVKNDQSKLWHNSYGGGLWLSYLDRTLNFVTTLANSKESLLFYFGMDFSF
ncbi:MAG: BamA/TamA family outer membrane protein [Ignavibacteriales bacterium]|nr:BamA/TamA family outer membrane protein [Ignavibacteriales bacterium]